MPNQSDSEQGSKWWIRHVIVPLIGGGGLIALIVAIISKSPSRPEPSPALESPLVAPSLPNWVAPFELEFQAGFWTEGFHEYTLAVDCSGSARDITASSSFTVSRSEGLLSDPVFLRLEGVHQSRLGIAPITQMNPLQPSFAEVTITHLTQREAGLAIADCAVSILVDSSPAQALIPQTPYQVLEAPGDLR